jgi:hypothetical protein
MALGGTPKGIAQAQRAAHSHILTFLAAELCGRSVGALTASR